MVSRQILKLQKNSGLRTCPRKWGDLSVNANWIHETNRFWYSYKTSSGKNFYYVNADTRTRQLMFDSRYMAAEIHEAYLQAHNELDLPIKEIEFEKGALKIYFQN
ncbi:MAG: hypothetical protein R2744_08205 [Bacteroidales bacterium]